MAGEPEEEQAGWIYQEAEIVDVQLNRQAVDLSDYAQRNTLAKRIMRQLRTRRDGLTFHYSPVNPLATQRSCHTCLKPATRERVAETVRGIDKSSKVYCCGNCE